MTSGCHGEVRSLLFSTVSSAKDISNGSCYLARADAASLGTAAQADCLRALERAEAVHTAARVNVLAAFHACGGCEPDGPGSARAWLTWQTKVTRGAAAGVVGWMGRLRGHPAVWEALAGGSVSASWARQICAWTAELPEASRGDADSILLGAAAGGVSLHDLGARAEEMRLRSRLHHDDDRDGFEDRALRFARTFGSAGRLEGGLTPAASAALTAVLDSLGAKAGPEDVRSQPQRWHDALEEACVRLIGAGMLPQRAGQPVHLQLQITLGQLRHLAATGASTAETAWATRAASSGLTTAEVEALACDATGCPVVTGMLANTALDQLVQPFLNAFTHQPTPASTGNASTGNASTGNGGTGSETIPGHLRRLIIPRDQHCQFPGCWRPPDACQVHHLIHRGHGGPTSLANCYLICRFHQLIAIHRWGWRLTAHPDRTMTATSPDGRTLHSHPPPAEVA